MKTLLALVVSVVVLVGGAIYYTSYVAADAPPSYRTATLKRGDLVSTISATGTVEPEEVVDVGAQVAGKISSLGRDPTSAEKSIDYGSIVHEGTELAHIDDAVYRAQVDQSQASLLRAQADLLQFTAKLDQADRDLHRATMLRSAKQVSETDYDLAVANQKVAAAVLESGKASVKQAEASLRLATTNLNYTIIKSPVEGVIVDRRVNIGQTVVASLNAPSLFLIAKDLRRMQVWASVNEADIGRIVPDMPVRFTVDAFPRTTFQGKVLQVRLNATMTQNVVTYTVVVFTDNSDRKLLPYLTANLQFVLDERSDVLLVPNQALRWRPKPEQIAPGKDDANASPAADKKKSGRGRPGKDAGKASEERGRIWVKDGKFVRPIDVTLGGSDGLSTEVNSPELEEGLEVVLGEIRADQSAGTTNPFAPSFGRGQGKKGE
jgi:HlyD family secretion protein